MFKRKAALPARPEPPKLEEIHEDIRGAPENDVIFTMRANDGGPRMSTNSDSGLDDSVNSDPYERSPEEVTYNKVKTFIDESIRMKETATSQSTLSDDLEQSGAKLEEHLVKVRKLLSVD